MKILDFSTKPLFLAPLAGYTDLPFRSVVKKFGADVTVSEMISANALVYNNGKTCKMIEKSERETPYSVQLAGNDKEVIKKAVELLNSRDGIDIIDLNCGCPAPKIANNGCGSGLLLDLDQLKGIVETIKKTSVKPYTSVKIRIGYREKQPVEIAKACEEAGADFIVVHGRTRADAYKGKVDYDAIKAIKAALSIPVIANGDITDKDKAQKVLAYTQADGLMIGRGAIGNPWIFHQIREGMSEIPLTLKREIILEHFEQIMKHDGEYGVFKFRKHLHTYSKGIKEAKSFREEINCLKDPKEVLSAICNYFAT